MAAEQSFRVAPCPQLRLLVPLVAFATHRSRDRRPPECCAPTALGGACTLRGGDEAWIANVELDREHRDLADRTIVALAQLAGARLVTSYRRILDFYSRAVW